MVVRASTVLFVSAAASFLNSQAGSGVASNGAYSVGSGAGMYSHIADAETSIGIGKTGTVILSAGYTDVITSSMQIGWPAGPGIKVFMMPGSTIQENIANGGPGIVIYEGSALECLGAAPSGSVNGQAFTMPGHGWQQFRQDVVDGDHRLHNHRSTARYVQFAGHYVYTRIRNHHRRR